MEILSGRTPQILALIAPYLTDTAVAVELDSVVRDSPAKTWWVAVDAGAVVGFCGAVDDGRIVEMESFYVRGDQRGRGVGSALYAARLAAYAGRVLHGWSSRDSVRMHERGGFAVVQEGVNGRGVWWAEISRPA